MKLPNYAKNDEFIGRGLKTFSQRKRLFSEIRKRLKNRQKIKLLEIGCGKGILLLQLNEIFQGIELHGLNLAGSHGVNTREDFIRNALRNKIQLNKNNLPYIHFADATKLPFNDSTFDIITSQVTFLHIKNKARAIEEIYRVLKKDGIALLSIGPYSILRNKSHAIPLFYKKLNRILKKDYNPRFLIYGDKKPIKLSKFIKRLNKEYNIKLWRHQFISKAQIAEGFWLIVKKNKNKLLHLPLKYNRKNSQRLTKLFAKNNPVNFGQIDVYDLAV